MKVKYEHILEKKVNEHLCVNENIYSIAIGHKNLPTALIVDYKQIDEIYIAIMTTK